MYSIIRCILVAIIGLMFFVIVKKNSNLNKKTVGVIIATCVLLLTTISFVPFENLFLTFGSAEKACFYYQPQTDGNVLSVDGQYSTFVMQKDDSKNSILLVPKTESGWKVPSGMHTKRVIYRIVDSYIVSVYQYKNTNDFFVRVSSVDKKIHTLTDSCNSLFVSTQSSVYCAHIPHFDTDYSLIINDKQIVIHE